MKDQIEIVQRIPTVAEFQKLEAAVGFREHDAGGISTALENSTFVVCALHKNEVVGVGRIVGDGAISFLLTNILVHPLYQRRGIGSKIVRTLCEAMETLPFGNMVLEVAPLSGLTSFYERNGFVASRTAPPGMVRWFHEIPEGG